MAKCDYCGKTPPKQTDAMPTWFGRYVGDKLVKVICVDCYKDKAKEWRENK